MKTESIRTRIAEVRLHWQMRYGGNPQILYLGAHGFKELGLPVYWEGMKVLQVLGEDGHCSVSVDTSKTPGSDAILVRPFLFG